jgi:uncharacterized protein YukE
VTLWDDARNAVTKAVHTVEGGVEHGIAAAAKWAESTFGSNTGRITSSDEAVRAILAGSSNQWHTGASTASTLAQQHQELSSAVLAFAGKFESAWTGTASDAAQHRMKKLGDALNVTSDTLGNNSGNVSGVASHFDSTKSKLVKLPGQPPEKGFFDTVSPWNTDTEDSINAYNKASQENQVVYHNYATTTRAQSQQLHSDYGQLGEFDGGDIAIAPGPETPPEVKHGKTGGTDTRNQQGHDTTPPPGTVTPPPSTGNHSVTPPGGHTPGTDTPSGHGSGHDGTNTAGWTPPSTGNVPGGSGWVPGGIPGGPGTDTRGISNPYVGGGVGWNLEPGTGTGSGGKVPGGPGSGGTGSTPGPGRQTGVRGPVEEPVTRGGPGTSRAGNRLNGGPGGMAPGGRGKGEEDQEHQRKYVVDSDQLFTEDGQKLVDPETGYPAVPPTIGT